MADSKLTELIGLSSTQPSDLLYVVSFQEIPTGNSNSIAVSSFFGNINVPVIVNNTLSSSFFQTPNADVVNLDVQNTTAQGLTATQISTLATVITANADFTVTYPAFNSKIVNVDTPSNVNVIFDTSGLVEGFNIGITNVGSNTVNLSSNVIINSVGTSLVTQYAGCFVYYTGGQLFAVGKFD